MRGLSLSDAVLVGFSMGGGEIARYMSRHAGRGVSAVAFVSSVVPGMPKSAARDEAGPARSAAEAGPAPDPRVAARESEPSRPASAGVSDWVSSCVEPGSSEPGPGSVGGTATAGPDGGSWVLTAELPRNGARG